MKDTSELKAFRQDIADAIEPYLSWEYNISIGRTDWAEEGLKSVSVGPAHELYQAVLSLVEKIESRTPSEYERGYQAGLRKVYSFTECSVTQELIEDLLESKEPQNDLE